MLTQRQFRALNARRIRLIDREFDGGLSEQEEEELAELDQVIDVYLEERFPLQPAIDHLEKQLRELKERRRWTMGDGEAAEKAEDGSGTGGEAEAEG